MKKEKINPKKYRTIFGTLCAMLIMLLITGAGGYTYAKYMTQESGVGSAEIAKWSFKIAKDGEEIKKVKLTDTVEKDTLVNGKIAPGTSGYIDIELDATGAEVGIDYIVQFSDEINKPTNIKFLYSGSWYTSLAEIGEIKGKIKLGEEQKARISIKWTWIYESGTTNDEREKSDEIDTNTGISALDYSFKINAKGLQAF